MATRKTVYCEYAFWEGFYKGLPSLDSPNDENIRRMQCWLQFYSFLSKSDLVLDITEQKFKEYKEKNSFLGQLWKKSANGECGLDYACDDFPDLRGSKDVILRDDQLNALYLTTLSTEECYKISTDLGVIILNLELALHCNQVFIDNGIAVPSETYKGWDFLDYLAKKYPYPCISNSLVIVDNYIFENADRAIEYNIIPLLNHLLPYSLAKGIKFNLSIFSYISPENTSVCEKLIEKIRNLRKDLDMKINVINVAQLVDGHISCKYFHDRAMITNNLWIGCGHGFDIFPTKKSTKPTTVNVIFPFIQSSICWCDPAFNNLLSDVKEIISSYKIFKKDYWGDDGMDNHITRFKREKKSKQKNRTSQEIEIFEPDHPVPGLKIMGKIDLSRL